MKKSFKKTSFHRAILPTSIVAAMILSGSSDAFQIETGNPDLSIRFDNTFRYNAGWRMSDPKWDLVRTAPSAGSSTGPSEVKFKEKGGMITNRLDVLSEFDFVYRESTGFRVSAASWYDKRYDNHTMRGYPTSNVTFDNGHLPDEIVRYYNGPSGEFLDAFVFTQFQLGGVPIDVKIGQHTVYWGETIFSLADGISYGQAYADLRKAAATPGVEAKEVFKPLNQFSFSAAITPRLALVGQYFFDWKPDQFPLGGTFFSPVDFLTYQGGTVAIPGRARWDGLHDEGLDKSGDWGLGAKWRPDWLDGSAGFFYRELTAKNTAALAIDPTGSVLSTPAVPGVLAQAAIYADPGAPRVKLYGFSLAKQIWGISWGMDLTYRKDAALATKSFSYVTGSGWAPVGDMYTGTLNMIAYDGKRALYDSAVLTAEFAYDALDKVTRNQSNFNGRANCLNGTGSPFTVSAARNRGYYGCATGQSYGITALFEPKWFQVWQNVDVTMPLLYRVGLSGNSAVNAVGQNEGQGSYSVGVTADVDATYNFALRYNGVIYKRHTGITSNPASTSNGIPFSNAPLGDSSDKGWLSFTAKATW